MSRVQGESYRINLSRQDLIRKYYQVVNGDYIYDSAPPTDDVTAIWGYLIDAGFDYKKADYKSYGYLRPVVITFTRSGNAELLDVKQASSSGNSEVDKAVLEGFKAATFSNSSGRKIKGRFTYSFD